MTSKSQTLGVELGDIDIQDDSDEPEDLLPSKHTLALPHSVVSSDEDEPNDLVTVELKTAGGNKRPRAADFEPAIRSVISTAIEIYCATLLYNDAYPSAIKEVEFARVAWDKANRHLLASIPLDGVRVRLVSTSRLYIGRVIAGDNLAISGHCTHVSSTEPIQVEGP